MADTATSSQDGDQDTRILNFRKVFVKDPTLVEILNGIGTLHRTGKGATHSQCMGLFGPSGSGKTRLVRYYERGFLKSCTERTYWQNGVEITILPLLFVESPARATVKGLAETLLTALGDPRPARGSQQEMTQRVLYWLQLRRVSLIVIDEFQHLLGRAGSQNGAYETADWLKSLLNANICPILLVGTEAAAGVLKVNEQLQRRSLAVHTILPYSISNTLDIRVFRDMLAGLERALGLALPSGLSDDDLARRIHAATDGLIGRVTGLLDRALILAIERQENCITRQTLHDVYARTYAIGGLDFNPFSMAHTSKAPETSNRTEGTRTLRTKGHGNAVPRAKDLVG